MNRRRHLTPEREAMFERHAAWERRMSRRLWWSQFAADLPEILLAVVVVALGVLLMLIVAAGDGR